MRRASEMLHLSRESAVRQYEIWKETTEQRIIEASKLGYTNIKMLISNLSELQRDNFTSELTSLGYSWNVDKEYPQIWLSIYWDNPRD